MNRLVLALLFSVAVALAACGDDNNDTDDPRIAQVGALSETATYAYADAGAAGLYDYMSAGVTEKCTADEFADALGGEPTPTGWRQTKNFSFDGEDSATATVILITDDGDVEQDWSFVLEGGSWRISEVPGLGDCAAS